MRWCISLAEWMCVHRWAHLAPRPTKLLVRVHLNRRCIGRGCRPRISSGATASSALRYALVSYGLARAGHSLAHNRWIITHWKCTTFASRGEFKRRWSGKKRRRQFSEQSTENTIRIMGFSWAWLWQISFAPSLKFNVNIAHSFRSLWKFWGLRRIGTDSGKKRRLLMPIHISLENIDQTNSIAKCMYSVIHFYENRTVSFTRV